MLLSFRFLSADIFIIYHRAIDAAFLIAAGVEPYTRQRPLRPHGADFRLGCTPRMYGNAMMIDDIHAIWKKRSGGAAFSHYLDERALVIC